MIPRAPSRALQFRLGGSVRGWDPMCILLQHAVTGSLVIKVLFLPTHAGVQPGASPGVTVSFPDTQQTPCRMGLALTLA